MTNMSIQPLWLTHFIEILLVLEFQLTKFISGAFSYKAHFRPQISSNAVLKFSFVPKSAKNPFQKLEVNLTSRSKTIALSNPCKLKISFMKILAMSSVLCLDFTGIKCALFVNLSTTTMMESCCL